MSFSEKDVFWYLHLSAEQEQLVERFAADLSSVGVQVPDHLVLKRFLRARQWNVKNALAMYQSMLQFRQDRGTDTIASTFTYDEEAAVQKIYPRFYHKTDRFGRPVYVELLGECDVARLLEVTTLDRFLLNHIKRWEHFQKVKLPACSAAVNKPIISTVAILDLAGLSLKNFTLTTKQFIQAVSRIDQDYYPEHLGALYIINAPFIFRTIWAFVKPLLDEGTAVKVQVLGTDYREVLLAAIPAENLLTRFGGTSVVEGFHDAGPWEQSNVKNSVMKASNVMAGAGTMPAA